MNINRNEVEDKHFSIEDVVSYSNIEITNVNDNIPPPYKISKIKMAAGIVIAALILMILFIK